MKNWEGVDKRDLIVQLNERDQAMAEMTEINKSLQAQRDQAFRELEWFKNQCIDLMVYKCKVEVGRELRDKNPNQIAMGLD